MCSLDDLNLISKGGKNMDQACSKPSEGAAFRPVGSKKNNGFSAIDAEGLLDVLLDLNSSLF